MTTKRRPAPLPTDRILRRPVVEATVGLGYTQIDAAEKRGEFPRRVKITPTGRAVGWLESEVKQYVADRAAARAKGGAS
jgi:predicted DNA-binding transcriptional regulator AlpA